MDHFVAVGVLILELVLISLATLSVLISWLAFLVSRMTIIVEFLKPGSSESYSCPRGMVPGNSILISLGNIEVGSQGSRGFERGTPTINRTEFALPRLEDPLPPGFVLVTETQPAMMEIASKSLTGKISGFISGIESSEAQWDSPLAQVIISGW